MARRGYLDLGWGQVHCRMAGDPGAPLLLMLHQSPLSSRNYDAVLPLLGAGGLRAVAVDTPGFGASDPLPAEWEVADYASFALACADALGAERFHLFGRATGSVFAAEAAMRAPNRVERLVLHGMPVYTDEERAQRMADFAPPYAVTDDGAHLMWIWKRIHTEYPWIDAALATQFTRDFLDAGPDFATAYRAIWRFDLRTRLAGGLPLPALLIGGERDRIRFMHDRATALLPDARATLLPEATDFVAQQDPALLARTVLEFLTG